MSSTTGPSKPAMRRLGDFLLLEEIGRGGMGRVYHARQLSLEREVALKVLPSLAGLDEDAVIRFRREAEAAARLSHPGIVPVYAIGEIDDTCFYAMELVEGPSLRQVLDALAGRQPQSLKCTLVEAVAARFPMVEAPPLEGIAVSARYPASCAALIMELAEAVTAAHRGQVIHRDIKPSNILLHATGRPGQAEVDEDRSARGMQHSAACHGPTGPRRLRPGPR